jgi:hypothetical protein
MSLPGSLRAMACMTAPPPPRWCRIANIGRTQTNALATFNGAAGSGQRSADTGYRRTTSPASLPRYRRRRGGSRRANPSRRTGGSGGRHPRQCPRPRRDPTSLRPAQFDRRAAPARRHELARQPRVPLRPFTTSLRNRVRVSHCPRSAAWKPQGADWRLRARLGGGWRSCLGNEQSENSPAWINEPGGS